MKTIRMTLRTMLYTITESLNKITKLKNLLNIKAAMKQEIENTLIDIPVLGWIPAEGPAMTAENLEGFNQLPLKMAHGGDFFILNAKDSSMADCGIEEGDQVLIKQQDAAGSGQTIIARVSGRSNLQKVLPDQRQDQARTHR